MSPSVMSLNLYRPGNTETKPSEFEYTLGLSDEFEELHDEFDEFELLSDEFEQFGGDGAGGQKVPLTMWQQKVPLIILQGCHDCNAQPMVLLLPPTNASVPFSVTLSTTSGIGFLVSPVVEYSVTTVGVPADLNSNGVRFIVAVFPKASLNVILQM